MFCHLGDLRCRPALLLASLAYVVGLSLPAKPALARRHSVIAKFFFAVKNLTSSRFLPGSRYQNPEVGGKAGAAGACAVFMHF
jgi:hypothetical protein